MESGEISSEQITASSQYNSNWSPERSRLNYQENGWTPSDDTIREWIQVSDFSGGWRTNWSYVTLVLVWQSDLRSVGRRKARSPRFEPCRTSEISLASGLNIVHSFVPLLHWKKTGNNPTCIIYWDLPLQRGWHIFLSSLWNLTYGSLRSLNVERLQQHNYFKEYAAGQVFRGKRCRQVGSYVVFGPRATNCFQFRLRSHQARFIQWTLKPFFSYFVECIQAGNRFPGTPALRGPNISASIIWKIQQSFLLRCT